MEFLDEYQSGPRFLFQSKQSQDSDQTLTPSTYLSSLHKPTLFISISFAILIFSLAIFHYDIEPLKSILLWLSFSLFLGPFAPSSLTGGDIRVGVGPVLKEPNETPIESVIEKSSRKSTKSVKKQPEEPVRFDGSSENSNSKSKSTGVDESNKSIKTSGSSIETKSEEESEWSEVDEELLKKLMGKHPVGKPGRWEAIAEGFKGRYKVEFVIARSKEIGLRKVGDKDSYQKFLKDRKPVDKRVIDEGENENSSGVDQNDEKESGWSSAEDLALLNALKAFPKDVAMRWEKIAIAVPGKTKAACMKRVTDLKKDFRSSKAS